jgi:hypothetical protein
VCQKGKWCLKSIKSGIPAQTIFSRLVLKKFKRIFSIRFSGGNMVVIIVFEIKEYSGLDFSEPEIKENGHRFSRMVDVSTAFNNPILQNKIAVCRSIDQLPQFQNILFYSLVVFFGNCEFRDFENDSR